MSIDLATAGSLAPYVPRLLRKWLQERPSDRFQEREGSCVFVDVAGFTKLSERLSRRGKVGAEELAEAIDACFTLLLSVAYGNGGGLIKFGGDALLLLFSGADHRAKACRAAVGMRRTLRQIRRVETSAGPVHLRMSVGVHSGVFHFFLVGRSHRELILTGPAASETVLMESTADAGEIIISPSTASHLPASVVGAAKGPGFLLRREPPGPTLKPPTAQPEPDLSALAAAIPPSIQQHLKAGVPEPEHRRVAVAFIRFEGIDELIERSGPAAAAAALDHLMNDTQTAVDRHGIAFLGTDIDRDGGKVILAAGAPSASENDEERLLLALHQLRDGDPPLPIRMGVTRGHVFAGDIGPPYRRTYTVMGDAVNLAARLMAKADPGQILSTEEVLTRARTTFASTALEPFFVKGKEQPLEALSVGPPVRRKRREEAESETPLIGREREMETLLQALESARRRNGRIVEIVGDPGIGKSRLVQELRRRAEGVPVLSTTCELYGSSTPYRPFRDLLRTLYGIPEDASDTVAKRLLQDLVDSQAPELLPWLRLLGIVIDLELPQTPETAGLGDEFIRSRLEQVTGEMVARLMPSSTLFVFEDVHWMDEASANLLRHLVGGIEQRPWMVCVTRREGFSSFTAPKRPWTISLRPDPLDARATEELVSKSTEDSPLRPHEIAALASRSGGNPLFLKELLTAAQNIGVDALPDSVEAVVAARIDRLTPIDRSILRRASVLGLTFDLRLLNAVLDENHRIDGRARQRLGEFIVEENDGFRFRHALIREAAYEGLPYRLRRELHGRVGETIEATWGDQAEEKAELLSLHFFNAARFEEAWRYSRIAGERAKTIYANVEAATFFQRALEAGKRIDRVTPAEVADVLDALGGVKSRLGLYQEATGAYRAARRRIRGDRPREAQLMLREAEDWHWLGRFVQAMRWCSRAMGLLEGIRGRKTAAIRAALASLYAMCRFRQGRPREAIPWCERAVREAKVARDPHALGDAYRVLDMVDWAVGGAAGDRYGRMALALYDEVGDVSKQTPILNNLAVRAVLESRYDEALALLERAEAGFTQVGDMQGQIIAAFNRGDLLVRQGRMAEGESVLQGALRLARIVGDQEGIAFATRELGRAATRSGQHDSGLALLREARSSFATLGARNEALDAEAGIAEGLLLRGQWREALTLATESIARARSAGLPSVLPTLNRVRGYALMAGGRHEEAAGALKEAVEVGRSENAAHEVAFSLAALAELARFAGDAVSAADLEAEGRSISERLGMAYSPPIPSRAAS